MKPMAEPVPMPLVGEHATRAPWRRPRTAIWEITAACNLTCVHCDNHRARAVGAELTTEHAFRVAESLARLGCEVVDITGGEPLLRPDWDAITRRVTDLGMEVALITNGTLLDDRALERAVRAGVGRIAVSIDGLSAVHDRIRRSLPGAIAGGASPWSLSMAGLERALKLLPVVVITQTNRLNLGELPALGRLLAERGVRQWQLQLVIPSLRLQELDPPFGLAPDDLEALTEFILHSRTDPAFPHIDASDTIGYYTEREVAIRWRSQGPGIWLGCVAGTRVVAIKYDGKVRGCSLLPPEFDAGDLHSESLEAIWADEERFAYSTRFDPNDLTGCCGGCEFGPVCRAGCRTMAYALTGTIYDNPCCLLRHRRARA
jgi:radical SAM protein with 4Fe4S-binding SPASM domain